MRYFTSDLHLAHPFVAATRGFWKPGMRPDRDVIEAPDGINQLRRELSEYRFNEAHHPTHQRGVRKERRNNHGTCCVRAQPSQTRTLPPVACRCPFLEQGEHPHNGCSPCFLPRCSGIPRSRTSNSAPTFEGLFEVFRWAVLSPFRAPARTEPLRRSFGGLSLGFGWACVKDACGVGCL